MSAVASCLSGVDLIIAFHAACSNAPNRTINVTGKVRARVTAIACQHARVQARVRPRSRGDGGFGRLIRESQRIGDFAAGDLATADIQPVAKMRVGMQCSLPA